MSKHGDMWQGASDGQPGPRSAPLSIDWRPQMDDQPMWTSPTRLYLDINGALVNEGDPAMQTLLVDAGKQIPLAQAVALGLAEVPSNEPERKPTKAAKK